ncbi:hypothetical protein ACF0H5_021681 [Mactra antiquata]
MKYGHLTPIILLFLMYMVITDAKKQLNKILMQYKGTDKDAKSIGQDLGLEFDQSVLEDFYTFLDTHDEQLKQSDLDKKVRELSDRKLKSLQIEKRIKHDIKAVTINDADWGNQWHYRTTQSPSMNVYNAWDKGFTGSGITIGIVDDGVEFDHSDLAANYVSSYSYDFIDDVSNGDHKDVSETHGTNCAGVAAAVKNTDCVIGAAYDASIASLRILGNQGATASEEAMALTYKLQNIDVYSNSWGPSDAGTDFYDINTIHVKAFEKGVTQGRGGLGAIYTWASGNGGWNHDDCNADGYAKSIYTIAVAAMSETTSYTWYSEKCSAILTAAYSGDVPNQQIATTAANDTCVSTFSGTSSACPVASGIIAQTLHANSSLTWRDIQHMIVETSVSSGLHANITVSTNGAGKQFSQYFGFGLIDAEGMVDTAATWSTVPSYTTCTYPKSTVDRTTFHTTITETYEADNCYITYLEWVEVTLKYAGYYRGDIQVDLQSPLSTTSTIFSRRALDLNDLSSEVETTFMSVHFWGEDPNGTWTLSLSDESPWADTDMKLDFWQLKFYGTMTDPLSGTPAAGSLGGSCSTSDDCMSVTDGGCLLDGKICVECNTNYRVVNSFCVQDGWTNGYCDGSISCVFSTDECIDNVCKVPEDESSSDNTGVIVGAVLGGAAGLALIGGGSFFMYKKFSTPKGRVGPVSDQPTNTQYRASDHPQPHQQQQVQQDGGFNNEPPPSYNDSSGGAHPV